MKSNREFLDGLWTRVGILESEEQQVRLAKHRDRSMARRMLGWWVLLLVLYFPLFLLLKLFGIDLFVLLALVLLTALFVLDARMEGIESTTESGRRSR
jgi:hypothetical protein